MTQIPLLQTHFHILIYRKRNKLKHDVQWIHSWVRRQKAMT